MDIAFETGRSLMGAARRAIKSNLPAQFSLLANMPQPESQGPSNSCAGWAAGFAAMSTIVAKRSNLTPFPTPNDVNKVFSPSFVYNQINGGTPGYADMKDALNLILTKGDATWALMPFQASDYTTQRSSAALAFAANNRISDWGSIE